MKKLACTVFTGENGEMITIVEYDNGTYEKIVGEEVVGESSLDEIQELVNSGKYVVQELTF